MANDPGPRSVLGIDLEDYFQAAAYRNVVPALHWPRFDARIPLQVERFAAVLSATGSRATFFADAWVAEQHPGVLAGLARRGHEIACLLRRPAGSQAPDVGELAATVLRTRAVIAAATGFMPCGFRLEAPLPRADHVALVDRLAKDGFAYDASARSGFAAGAGPARVTAPLPAVRPWSGGIASAFVASPLRQLPDFAWRRTSTRRGRRPASDYLLIKSWEIDPAQPRITAAPGWSRALHGQGLARVEPRLAAWLAAKPAQSIADRIGLERSRMVHTPQTIGAAEAVETPAARRGPRVPVTLVVPAFNEAPTLAFLARALERFEHDAGAGLQLAYVFVDDASTDATSTILRDLFGARAHCRIVTHPANLGITGATLTGIAAAETEIVAVIDADCSYDPATIARMIPLLAPGVALVTASPYHPQGRVIGVPAWRLWLSRRLSGLYGAVLATRLHTYTACVRVYRKSAMTNLPIRNTGYLGMAEIIAALDRRGDRVVECPAVLETRLFGQSKMKIARTIAGHLGLIASILAARRNAAKPTTLERQS